MASAEQLKVTHSVDDRVRGVEGQVQDARDDVQAVGNKVQDVEDRVQGIDNNVRVVDDKLDQVNRRSSLKTLIIIPPAQTTSKGTSLKTVFYDGFRPQIHPPTIILHAKPITRAQLNGSSREVYSTTGNRLDPSYGYMENVRCS